MSGVFRKCDDCGERDYFGSSPIAAHRCKPAFEVRIDDGDEEREWRIVRAFDAETAAEKYAEWFDCECAEYMIVGGSDQVIDVRPRGTADVSRFTVRGETEPHYYAIPKSE